MYNHTFNIFKKFTAYIIFKDLKIKKNLLKILIELNTYV